MNYGKKRIARQVLGNEVQTNVVETLADGFR